MLTSCPQKDPFQTHLDSAWAAFKAKKLALALQHALLAKFIYERTAPVPISSKLGLARRELYQRLGEFINTCLQVRDFLGAGVQGGSAGGLEALKAPPIGSCASAPGAKSRQALKSTGGRSLSRATPHSLRPSSRTDSPGTASTQRRTPTKDTVIELRLEAAINVRGRLPKPEKQKKFFKDGKLLTIADFAYSEKKIAIFCDGWRYHGNKDAVSSDAMKRNELTAHGWKVLTFWGKDIYRAPAACEAQIWELYCRNSR